MWGVGEVLRLGKIIDLRVYYLVEDTSTDDSANKLFKSLVNRRVLDFSSFIIGSLKYTDDFGFDHHLDAELQGGFLEHV